MGCSNRLAPQHWFGRRPIECHDVLVMPRSCAHCPDFIAETVRWWQNVYSSQPQAMPCLDTPASTGRCGSPAPGRRPVQGLWAGPDAGRAERRGSGNLVTSEVRVGVYSPS